MSKGYSPRPYNAERYGENFNQIFRKDDPIRSTRSGCVRVWRSDCCEAPVYSDNRCCECHLVCSTRLVEINQ
jgi:hypothetical protein